MVEDEIALHIGRNTLLEGRVTKMKGLNGPVLSHSINHILYLRRRWRWILSPYPLGINNLELTSRMGDQLSKLVNLIEAHFQPAQLSQFEDVNAIFVKRTTKGKILKMGPVFELFRYKRMQIKSVQAQLPKLTGWKVEINKTRQYTSGQEVKEMMQGKLFKGV